jgi:hypothetical protein
MPAKFKTRIKSPFSILRYHDWIEAAHRKAEELQREDEHLAAFVKRRREEIRQVVQDYQALWRVVHREQWDPQAPYEIARMKRPLYQAPGLSERAHRALASQYFENIVHQRAAEGRPFTLQYIIKRSTALDWNVLDLFYQICGFEHFKKMFDLAEHGRDEGPVCNLALISKYLSRFNDEYVSILTAELLDRIAEFDAMRMFYVALSRAKNLVVIAHFKGQGQRMNEPFRKLLDDDFPRIPDLDLATLPAAQLDEVELPKNYSYTGDFLLYLQCPRQYMVYRKYGFAPSRSLTMMFGNLVHRTLDDLHQFLIAQKSKP